MDTKSQPDSGRRWEKHETQFLRKHYKDMTAREISEALNRSVFSIYNKSQQLKLYCRRKWTEKEKIYALDAIGRLSAHDVGLQIFRSTNAVREFWKRNHAKVNDYDDETVKSVCKSTNLSEYIIYQSLKDGTLTSQGRQVGGSRHYYFSTYDDIRPFVLKRFPLREFRCMECQEPVIGDIVCAKHASYMELPPKPSLPSQFTIHVDSDYRTSLRDALLSMRQQACLDQESVSTKAGYNPMWWGAIERGKPITTPEDLAIGANVMGWDVEIVIKKRKET